MLSNSFDQWNEQKKAIDARKNALFFAQPRDVWFCYLGRNVDVEMNGGGDDYIRPVLIVKPFNRRMVWAIPFTTKAKRHDFHYRFTDPFGNSVAANVAQLRLLSTKRLMRRIYKLPETHFDQIRTIAIGFLSEEKRTAPHQDGEGPRSPKAQ